MYSPFKAPPEAFSIYIYTQARENIYGGFNAYQKKTKCICESFASFDRKKEVIFISILRFFSYVTFPNKLDVRDKILYVQEVVTQFIL